MSQRSAQELLAAYRQQYPVFQALAEEVERILDRGLVVPNSKLRVSGRAKQPASYVLKALRKISEKPEEYGADPLAVMPDKAGVRVVVADLESMQLVIAQARELLDVYELDDKRLGLNPNELGYLAVHLGTRLRADWQGGTPELLGIQCEVQVHTIAQTAWAEVSHPLLYKPVGVEPSKEVESRVLRAMALVSLFDDEIAGAQAQVKTDPLYLPATMLATVTAAAIDWRADEPDPDLSLEVLQVLQHAYRPDELERFENLLASFVDERRGALDATFRRYSSSDDVALIHQPETVAVFERLARRPEALRAAWIDSILPIEFLDELATAFPV